MGSFSACADSVPCSTSTVSGPIPEAVHEERRTSALRFLRWIRKLSASGQVNGSDARRLTRAQKPSIALVMVLCAVAVASFSCTTEQVPLHVSADHPASVQATEVPLPLWTSRLPLDDASGPTAVPKTDSTPAPDRPVTPPSSEPAKQLYTCPMHAQIVRDAPGRCPICNMQLVPKKPEAHDHGGHP